jgi:hypothetical protein
MKAQSRSIIVTCVALAAVFAGIAAMSPAVRPLAPYEREQTKRNVRVVLLKVERGTIFTTNGIRDPKPGMSYPVPVVGFTFLVEALGDEPIKNWISHETDDEVLIGNRKARDDSSMPDNLVAGGSGGINPALPYKNRQGIELPESFVEKRSFVHEEYERAVPSKTGTMRLKLITGFNDQKETFIFENIPLN